VEAARPTSPIRNHKSTSSAPTLRALRSHDEPNTKHTLRSQLALRRRLEGLRSLCRTSAVWRALRPLTTWSCQWAYLPEVVETHLVEKVLAMIIRELLSPDHSVPVFISSAPGSAQRNTHKSVSINSCTAGQHHLVIRTQDIPGPNKLR
jgi:hypothetical protein